jgi:ectoine hydroxylase
MQWRKEKNTATIDPLLLATTYYRQNDEIMDTDYLAHVLTDQERQFFNTHGYLVIPNALDETTTSRLVNVIDRVDRRERTEQHSNHLLSVTDIVAEDESLIRLIDHPTTFPKIWGVLGWNIYLYHSHLDVTPSDNVEAQSWSVAWHQDSMRVNDEIESDPRPRLSVKIGYYLTDVSEPNRGNTLIVPGSHLQNKLDCPEDGQSNPAGTEPLCVPAGSAIILDRRVWHTRSSNTSGITRKVIWYGYSYRWLRPKDKMTVEQLYPDLNPIQRQLLGDGLSANGVYDPQEGDVPLRSWLQEHDPAAAGDSPHGHSQSRPPAGARGKNIGRN